MLVKEKERLDEALVRRGLVSDPEKALAVIMTGRVLVDGIVFDKPGTEVKNDAEIVILEKEPYVSRGGIKLEGVLNHFDIDVHGATVMDVGASTGGFTDCLLKRGAQKVYTIDVGKGLLDWRLRNDKRVVVLEGKNIRYLESKDIGEKVDIAVIGVCESAIKGVKGNKEFWIYLRT